MRRTRSRNSMVTPSKIVPSRLMRHVLANRGRRAASAAVTVAVGAAVTVVVAAKVASDGTGKLSFLHLKAPDHQIRRLFIFGNGHVCRDLGMRSRWYSEPQPNPQGA